MRIIITPRWRVALCGGFMPTVLTPLAPRYFSLAGDEDPFLSRLELALGWSMLKKGIDQPVF